MKRVIGILLLCLLPYVSKAGEKHWASPVNGNFNDGSKWVPSGVPGINDDVFISTNGTFTVTVNNNSFGVRNLEIGGGTGLQTLIVTNASFFVATTNTVVTTNGVLIQNSSSMEGGGIYNSGTLTIVNSTISANTVNDGGIFVDNTPGGNGGIFNGSINNGPGGTITISNSLGNPNGMVAGGGIFNQGTLTITSSTIQSNATTALVLQNGLTNVTGGVIVMTPDANNDGILDIGTNGGGLFNNGGSIIVNSTTTIIQRSSFHNGGGVFVNNGTLDIIQGVGRSFDNEGAIFIQTSASVFLLSGDFFPRSSSQISGGGIFNFDAATISNGPLLCTNSTLHFRGVSILNSTILENSSQVVFEGANNVQGPIENHPGGSITIQSTNSFQFGSLQSGGGIYNGGSIFITSASTTNFSSVQLQCSGGPLINDGGIFVSRNLGGPPEAFSFQDVSTDGIRVENNGLISVLPGGNSFFILRSSPFEGANGTIQVGSGGLLGLGSQTSFTSSLPLSPITTSTLQIQPSGRLDVFSSEPGALFEMNFNSPTSFIQNDGTIVCDIPLVDPTNAPPLSGNGELIVRNAQILGPLQPLAGPGITIQNCVTSTSASLLFNGANNSILDRNIFNGPVSIATNCQVFVNEDPLGNRGPDNVSDNVFSNSVINFGELLFNRNLKTVYLQLTSTSGVLINNGIMRLHTPTTSTFFLFDNSRLVNNNIISQTSTSSSFSLHLDNSSIQNNGLLHLTTAIISGLPSAGSGLFLNNSVFANSTSSEVFLTPTPTIHMLLCTTSTLVNHGTFRLFPRNSTKTSISLLDQAVLDNKGLIVSTTASIFVSSSSLFVNSGQVLFSSTVTLPGFADKTGLHLQGGGVFENSTTGTFVFNRFATTATIFIGNNSRFTNSGDFEGDRYHASPGNSSLPSVNMGGGIFINSTGSSLRFRNFATTATIFLGSSSRFENHGTAKIERHGGGLVLLPPTPHVFVTQSGLFLNATNSTLRLFDHSPATFGRGVIRFDGTSILDNGGLFIGKSLLTTATGSFYLSEGSVILRNNSTFINRTTATFKFRNFATTATIFLGDATRWTNQGTSDVRSHWTPSTNSSIRISEPRMKLSSNSQFSNSGTFRFRNFATTATIFLGDASRWNNSGIFSGQSRTTIATQGVFAPGTKQVRLDGSSQVDNPGTIRFRNFATTATIFLGDASRWNNSGTTDFIRIPTQGIVFDPHVFVVSNASIHNATNAIFTFRNYTPPSVHTPTLKLEDNSCVESSGHLELDSRFGQPTNATVFMDSGEAHLSGTVKFDNKPEGKLVFRNFRTTATIFLGGTSRFINSGTTDIFKQASTATVFLHPPSHDVRVDGNALLQNATNAIFRHHNFGEAGTIRLDNAGGLNNNGLLVINRHPTNATVFPPAVGSGILGTGNSQFNNNTNGRLHIRSYGTSASVRLQGSANFMSMNEVGYIRKTVTTATGLLSYPFQALELEGNSQVTIASTGRMFFQDFEQPILIAPDGTSRVVFRGDLDFNNVFSTSQILTHGFSFLELSNRLLVSNASLCVEQTTNSSVQLSTSLQITLNSGLFQYKGTPLVFSTSSSFSGSGTLAFGTTVTILGGITPGSSPGQLIFDSDLVLGPESTILIEIDGQTPGLEHDHIVVNGHLTRNGTVTVTNGNYMPPHSTIFEIIEHNSVSGTWDWQGLAYPSGEYSVTSTASLTYLTSSNANATVQVAIAAYLSGYWDGSDGRITPVILEARTGATLSASSLVERQTALMTTAGTATVEFNTASGYNWLVLRHAGTLDVGSATPLNFDTNVSADFTVPAKVHNGSAALVQTTVGGVTVYVIRTGDLDGDNASNATDFLNYFLPNFGRVNPGAVPD